MVVPLAYIESDGFEEIHPRLIVYLLPWLLSGSVEMLVEVLQRSVALSQTALSERRGATQSQPGGGVEENDLPANLPVVKQWRQQ